MKQELKVHLDSCVPHMECVGSEVCGSMCYEGHDSSSLSKGSDDMSEVS